MRILVNLQTLLAHILMPLYYIANIKFAQIMILLRFYFLTLIMMVLPFTVLSQDDWDLARNKNDIKIYTRSIENSKLKHHKGVAIIDAPFEQVYQAMINVEEATDWVYNCLESRILQKHNDSVLVYYSTYKAPWPTKNRDLVTKLTYYIEDKTGNGVLIYETAEGYIDLDNKFVRITEYYDITTIVPIGDNQVKIIMEGYTDPGGNIPSWIVNMFIADGPYESMIGLKKIFGWEQD
jgi:uncharacterized membrane protein